MAATRASFFSMLSLSHTHLLVDHGPLRGYLWVPDAMRPTLRNLPPIGGAAHAADDSQTSTSRQSRDVAPPPTRKLQARAPPRGRSQVQLQNSDALLQRGLLRRLRPAPRPTLPPRRAPHIPATPSWLTRLVILPGIASRRSGASRPRCPRRRRPPRARLSQSKCC